MPTVFTYNGYKFFFFSNEGNPRERIHIHVRKEEKLAKLWLEPSVVIAENYGFSSPELAKLLRVAETRKQIIKRCWNEFFFD